MLAHYNTIGQA